MLGRLTYLFFNNSNETQEVDYVGLKSAKNLKELYFLKPTNTEVEKMCSEMSKTDYLNLTTLGLYGFKESADGPSQSMESRVSERSGLTDISCLDWLTSNTKDTIKTLYLQNNLLTNFNGIQNFKNLTGIVAQFNNFTDISSLSKLSSLVNLKLYECGNDLTSLEPLENCTKLKIVHLTSTSSIKSLKELISDNKSLDRLYAQGLENLDFSTNSEFWTEENKLKLGKINDLKLSTKYSMLFLNSNSLTLDKSVTSEEFEALINNNTVKTLTLNGNTLVDDDTLQKILPTMKKLEVLDARGSNLLSLDWCKSIMDKNNLLGVDIRDTEIKEITQLKDFNNLYRLYADGEYLKIYDANDEDLTSESTTIINNICKNWDKTNYKGFLPGSVSLCEQLEKLTELTNFRLQWRRHNS